MKRAHAPSDRDKKGRGGYYAHLAQKYKGVRETENKEGRVVVWTVGSAVEEDGRRKAGAGIFYGEGNPKNKSIPVEGAQTNQRAELTALLRCLEAEEGPVEVRTDSRYVQLGVQTWRHQWRARAWYRRVNLAKEVDHADLWQKVDNIIMSRPGELTVTWVKGHALPRHIAAGMTTEQDIWGINAADILAGAASA